MVNKNFDIMRNGYNRYQVDDYVEHLTIETERLKLEIEKNTKEIVTQQQRYDEINFKYKEMLEQLSVKENAAEGMSRMALREANLVIDTATNNADLIINEALNNAKTILSNLLDVVNKSNLDDINEINKKQIQNLLKAINE